MNERRFDGVDRFNMTAPDYDKLCARGYHFAHICAWEADTQEMWDALHCFRE